MDFAAIIPNLKAKLARTNERLAKLGETRRPYALDAAIGDVKAKKAIEKIDAQVATARGETDTLTLAIEEAEKRRAEHEAQVAAEDRLRREAEARAICGTILEADREFDRTAERLCLSLIRREELVRKLMGLGVIYPGVVNALRRRQNVNAALAHAGVHRFADLNLGPPNLRRPLAELDRSLRNPMMTRTAAGDDPASGAGPTGRVEIEEARL